MNEETITVRGGIPVWQTTVLCTCGLGIAAVCLVRAGYELGVRHARKVMRELRGERRQLKKEKRQFYRAIRCYEKDTLWPFAK